MFALIGDAAYSIYILHPMVLPVITRLWKKTGVQSDGRWNGIYLALCVAACTGAGILCYRRVEMPLFRFFDRITKRKLPATRLTQVSA